MRKTAIGVMVGVLALWGATRAQAQTVFGQAGVASLWDDETFLGRGIALSGGVAQPLGRHLAVEGEVAWARHHRDAGYLEAEGTPLTGTGRLAWLFQPPESRARGFASAGLAIVHSSGTLTTRSTLPGPGGLPIPGPESRHDWSVTRPAFEFGGGVSIAASDRVAIRPQVHWMSTATAAAPGAIELPIWNIRAGVAVEWRLR